MSILGGLGSLFSGGALGVVGAVGSGILDFCKTREANKQQLLMFQQQVELAKIPGDQTALLEGIKLVGASYEQDKAAYTGDLSVVDYVRGLLRPLVTLYLVAVSTGLAVWAFRKVGINDAVVSEIAKYAVYTCLDLTGMCISWYFGARQIDKINQAAAEAKAAKKK